MVKRIINTPQPGSEKSKSLIEIEDVFKETDDELAAFVGQTMIMTPGDLIFDPNIIDGAVRYWCALRSYFAQPGEICRPPTQEDMSIALGINRKTAGTYFNMLRATRWITVLKVIKQNNLEIGYSYLLHDTRTKLETVLRHDKMYLNFLCENTNAKNKRLRDYCRATILHFPNNELINLTREQKIILDTQIQKLPIDENPDVQNLPSGENSDVQNLPSGKNSDVQNLPSGKNSDVQNLPSGKNSDVQNLPSGDIYNTARVHTPTRLISVGDNNTTSSSKSFTFFQKSELLKEILSDMEKDRLHFGKSAVHAIKNCLKQKNYDGKGKSFRWICSEEKAAEMLIVLLAEKPDSVLPYLKKLIFNDYHDEFLLKPKQRQLLNGYRKRINRHNGEEQQPKKRNETPLEKFFCWLNTGSDKREFEPLPLHEGQRIKANINLQQFDIKSEAVTELVLPVWITDKAVRNELIATGVSIDESNIDRVSSLYLCFDKSDKTLDYEAVCKGIELGLFSLEDI